MNPSHLTGQTAIVTGGGRGFGREIARALTKEGVKVAVVARSTDQLMETISLIHNEGGHAIAVTADVTKWLKKGKKIYVEGRIQARSYDDKNTAAKKYITEIVADNIIMLDSKGAGEGSSASPGAVGEAARAPAAGRINDDLPF